MKPIFRNGEKVGIESILQRFNNNAAPALRGKPKYFLIQATLPLVVLKTFLLIRKKNNNTIKVFIN